MKYLKLFDSYNIGRFDVAYFTKTHFVIKYSHHDVCIARLTISDNIIDYVKIHKEHRRKGIYIKLIKYALKNVKGVEYLISKKGSSYLDVRSELADSFWEYVYKHQKEYDLKIVKLDSLDYIITL